MRPKEAPYERRRPRVGAGPWRRRIDEVVRGCRLWDCPGGRKFPPGSMTGVGCPPNCPAAILLRLTGRICMHRSLLPLPPYRYRRVINSVAVGRRQAGRAIAWQAVATLLTALACLWWGWKAGAAALVGGAAVLLGGWIAARIGLGGGIDGAVPAMARL